MLEKIKRSQIRQKLLVIVVIFFLLGLIANIGLLEVVKMTDIQRLEREHMESLSIFELRTTKLAYIQKPAKSSQKIAAIIDGRSDTQSNKGLIQLLEEMKVGLDSFYDFVSPVELFLLKMTGVGREMVQIAEKDYEDIAEMQKVIEDYKNHNISYDRFVEKLTSYAKTVRGNGETASEVINYTSHLVGVVAVSVVYVGLFFVLMVGLFIYKRMMIPLNDAKINIHTSSQELQANSKQQLQATLSQTTAIGEISSVMQELVATSGQVFELSSNASSLAKDTDAAVHEGHMALDQTIEGINKIREKVEVSVSDMLSLGEKSQQIGIVLDVINELSQQVTVLSYNATIEAAGAGEMGKRFMAVADRIIKLAERSVESAKEIKSIIDDVQTDSNKTIMSTEDSIKAVEYGVARSVEVKQSLEKISDFTRQVLISVDEINMSINQQKTGVEQAASEVGDITTLVRETEDSSKQALETANNLIDMARMLGKV